MASEKGFRAKFKDSDVAVTFRDLILLPGWTEVEPSQVEMSTHVSLNHSINIPFVSSPMDTVTESEMAISLARLGGLGVLHRNCTIEEEVEMARKVKRAESLIIRDVITISPGETVKYATELMQKHNISGLPVVQGEHLVGILTGRDVRFADPILLTSDVMTKKVITAPADTDIEGAKEILHKHRVEKLPLIDKEGRLRGLMTIKDILLRGRFPNAARDDKGQLLCGAAVSPFDLKRAKKLSEFADILVIDVAHFHNANVFAATKKILEEVETDVIVGSIGTYSAAEDILTKLDGVAGFRVGIGSGSICTTMEATKAGSPTVYATAQVADAVRTYGSKLPIIADGGIRGPGDAAVALSLGASAVMMGNLFARSKEAPGTLITIGGRYYKQYRGMGSPSAMAKRLATDRYAQPSKGLPEGVEGWVPYKGEVSVVTQELVAGLQASMGYSGARTIHELWEKARLAGITNSGAEEARPHDVLLPSEHPDRV
jgi:IMP dehydrogenase